MKQIICDRCGTIIDPTKDTYELIIRQHIPNGGGLILSTPPQPVDKIIPIQKLDLCEKCANSYTIEEDNEYFSIDDDDDFEYNPVLPWMFFTLFSFVMALLITH